MIKTLQHFFEHAIGCYFTIVENYRNSMDSVFTNDDFGVYYFDPEGYIVFKRGYLRSKNDLAYEVFRERLKDIQNDSPMAKFGE